MNPTIVNNIKQTLNELETEKQIHILMAIESGSRGWGFPSSDSDYDCRFVYAQSLEKYLTIGEVTDHISLPVDEIYDVDGWDLKKLLIHIKKSNPTVWEWLQSPIIYREEKEFREQCMTLAKLYFNEKTTLYHYKSLAYNKVQEIKETALGKLKAYFYALRSALACDYVLNYHSIPPMEINKLMDSLKLESELISEIEQFIALKATVDEAYVIESPTKLLGYIEKKLLICDDYLQEAKSTTALKDTKLLDEHFRNWVTRWEK